MTTLQQLIDTISANSEEDVTKLLQMMNPTSAEEMGPIYIDVLGYNPIKYFDEKIIERQIDKLIPYAPNKAGQILVNKKKEIIKTTLDLYDQTKETWIQGSLLAAIRDFISEEEWDDEELDEAFDDMDDALYDSDEEDDESEYTEEDSDEEDELFGLNDDEED